MDAVPLRERAQEHVVIGVLEVDRQDLSLIHI